MRFSNRLLAGAIALIIAACGGDDGPSTSPDAMPQPRPDADPADLCEEFVTPAMELSSFPAVFNGSLAGAGADIDVQPGACEAQDAPFGVRVPGPDQVIALRDLIPGRDYMVRLFSSSDLAVYVATGCSIAGGGPTAGQCLLYVDGSTSSPERGAFTAPDSGIAYAVVDFFLSGDPSNMTYSLEVYEAECSGEGDAACSGAESFCVDRRCVECANSFHCGSQSAPVCDDRSNECGAAFDNCVGDDGVENGDDGPAGALDITPTGTSQNATGSICNAPSEEADFYKFTVATPGEFIDVDLDWPDATADIDLDVFDQSGARLGMSFWERPESISLTFLPAGTYFARVRRFGAESTAVSSYTINVTRQGAMSCSGAADCASEFDNQLFRGNCSGGACNAIDGAASLPIGALCDSVSDCASGLCTSFFFNQNADTRSRCTSGCTNDLQCQGLGADHLCTDFLIDNFCVQKCTSDLDCPVLTSIPPAAGPWHRLSCELATGRCRL